MSSGRVDSRQSIISKDDWWPSVAIIIVNWNSFEVTQQCLESLKDLKYLNYEVIVIDNGSTDASVKKLKKSFSEITMIESDQNLGFTGGNNLGIKYALEKKHDSIMLLNNDTIVTPAFVNLLMSRLTSENLAAIQPKIMYNFDRDMIWNVGGDYWPFFTLTKTIGEGSIDEGQFDHLRYTDWITGCCFLIWSDVVKKIGLLDDKFFIYHEDADWSLKIRQQGMKMAIEPKSVIFHQAGMSDTNRDKHGEGNVSPFSRYLDVRNHLFMVRRYARGINLLGAWAFQFFKISIYLVYFVFRGRKKKLKAVLHGVRDGLIQ